MYFLLILIKEYCANSKIKLVIEGGGEQKMINDAFYINPSKVFINGIYKESCIRTCDLSFGINNVTLEFDDIINKCDFMFSGLSNITEIDLSDFDTSKVVYMSNMFSYCTKLKKINLWNINTTFVKDMMNLFKNCEILESIDLSYFDTSSVTNMKYMFSNCKNIKSINASSFNTSNVEDMEELFGYCENLIAVDVSSFNTSKAKNMRGMFYHCMLLKYLDLSNFSGSSVTNMNYMFSSCNFISLNLKNFKINNYGTLEPNVKFNGAPQVHHFCLQDSETYNYFKTDEVLKDINSDCFDQCFQNNIKISSDNCVESCSGFDYNNICYEKCPEGTYKLINNICSDIIPENYYFDNNDNIYKPCYKTCKKCSNFGDKTNNNCDECKKEFTFLNESLLIEKNCYQKCENYYYINKVYEYLCVNSCPEEYNKLIIARKKCIDECLNDNIYIYEYDNTCLEKCPNNTKIDIVEKKCYDSCPEYKFEYNNTCLSNCPNNTYRIFIDRNICIENIPENYYRDNTDNIYKECYYSCKKCNQPGNESKNNCIECKNNYIFINEPFIAPNNCYKNCEHYYYFDENNNYKCTQSNICPQQYNKLVVAKKKCIDECINDDKYIYEFNNTCLKECLDNLKADEEEKKCKIPHDSNQIEFDNGSYNDFLNITIKSSNNINNNQNNINSTIDNIIYNEKISEETIIMETSEFNYIILDNFLNYTQDLLINSFNSTNIDMGNDFIKIFEGVIFTITTSSNQKNNTSNNHTLINLGKCEDILREVYNISRNKNLYIFYHEMRFYTVLCVKISA